jgi:hypothetical protein
VGILLRLTVVDWFLEYLLETHPTGFRVTLEE